MLPFKISLTIVFGVDVLTVVADAYKALCSQPNGAKPPANRWAFTEHMVFKEERSIMSVSVFNRYNNRGV